MKSTNRLPCGLLVFVGFIALFNLSHAQETTTPVQTTSDLDTMLEAVESTTPTAAADVPEAGTFYSAQNQDWAPSPADVVNVPAWNLGGGFWLLDDLDYDYSAASTESLMAGRGMLMMDGLDSPDVPSFSFQTNGLWLQITNVADGLASVNLMNATDSVYEIWSKTDLSLTNWTIEAEVWPTDTNCMPFTVPTLDRTNLFVWARDWTGIDENSNGLPDWWEWKYFGNLDQSATNDYDGDGVDNDDEYLDDTDPNKIGFFLQFTNDYINTSTASGTVAVFGGVPSYMTVLVDDANYAGAGWTACTSTNITAYLGLTEGWHNVTVGLRGRPADAAQSWQGTRLKLDTIPPVIIVTNPVAGTVSQPMIQVQGLVNEQLSSLMFDVSNATGVFTNQTGYATEMFYDTNTLEFTTNSFQCYDVALTNGLNVISIHATDLAGNETTTNLAVTLDYSGDTMPPVIQLVWPDNGALVSGSNFTLRAQVDDATAKVTAAIVDSAGNTNSVPATVERDGGVRAENLPLAAGTNTVTVTASDAAGNVSTTNFLVVQSAVNVTMNPLSDDQLNSFFVSVNGTVSDASGTVTVNGITATVNPDGTWSAGGVPVSPFGRVEFNVAVTDGSGHLLASQSATTEQPVTVDVLSQAFNRGVEPYMDGTCGITVSHLETEQWTSVAGGVYTYADVAVGSGCAADHANETDDLASDDGYLYGYFLFLWENAETRDVDGFVDELGPLFFRFNRMQTQMAVEPGGGQVVGRTQAYVVFAQAFEPEEYNFAHRLPLPPEWLAINGRNLVSTRMTNEDDMSYFKGAVWGVAVVQGPAGVQVEATPVATRVFGNFKDVYFDGVTTNLDLQSLTVVSNSATQIDATNWAVVKLQTSDYVIVQAKLSITNDWFLNNPTLLAEAGAAIQWSGGEAVPGNPLQRRVTKTNSVETTVTASLGSSSQSLNVWVIWANLTVKVSGTLDSDDKAAALVSGNWPTPTSFNIELVGGNGVGGGNGLGPIDCLSNPNLNYSFTVGKIEAKAVLQPSGIGNILANTNVWNMKRTRILIAWDNGGNYKSGSWASGPSFSNTPPGVDDTSDSPFKYLNPANGDIFDLDFPGCSTFFDGTTVNHTSEVYANFYEYVTVNLGSGDQICSTTNTYSYAVQVDVDATSKILLNSLSTSLITIPTNPNYTQR